MGLQLIGKPFTESILIGVAHAYEALTDWHVRKPSQREIGLGQ